MRSVLGKRKTPETEKHEIQANTGETARHRPEVSHGLASSHHNNSDQTLQNRAPSFTRHSSSINLIYVVPGEVCERVHQGERSPTLKKPIVGSQKNEHTEPLPFRVLVRGGWDYLLYIKVDLNEECRSSVFFFQVFSVFSRNSIFFRFFFGKSRKTPTPTNDILEVFLRFLGKFRYKAVADRAAPPLELCHHSRAHKAGELVQQIRGFDRTRHSSSIPRDLAFDIALKINIRLCAC